MTSNWEDLEDEPNRTYKSHDSTTKLESNETSEQGVSEECCWGFSRQDTDPNDSDLVKSDPLVLKFIELYERYLNDKQIINHQTKNHKSYISNPQKAICEWFDHEGHEFSGRLEQQHDNQFLYRLELPISGQEFPLVSEVHTRKQSVIEEVCMTACKLLDECDLLQTSQQSAINDLERKKRIHEANKEDDIELDCTKRHCTDDRLSHGSDKTTKLVVNTYESLTSRWSELNMSIIGLKAKLVKLNLSISDLKSNKKEEQEADDDQDPLDAFMSNLNKKTTLTIDEKIEKSRIKSHISALEIEQEEVGRLIEIAKPKFDLDKAFSKSSKR